MLARHPPGAETIDCPPVMPTNPLGPTTKKALRVGVLAQLDTIPPK